MKDEEIRASIKQDLPHITDKDIDDYLEHNNKTLQEYREWLDRALAARRKDNPNYPGKMPEGFVPEHLKRIRKETN